MRATVSTGLPGEVEPTSTSFGALIAGGNRLAPTESADETEEDFALQVEGLPPATIRRKKGEIRRRHPMSLFFGIQYIL